jgi:hypothetical protein
MRTTTARVGGLAALLALLLVSTGMGQPPAGPKDEKKPAEEKKPSQLEELIAQALRDNPDVRVAEAKVHEAEALLNRARLQVIQKIVAHQQNTEALDCAVKTAQARAVVAEANYRLAEAEQQRLAEIFKKGVGAKSDVDAAEVKVRQAAADVEAAKGTLQAAKAELAKAQAELPYLVGKGTKDSDATEEAAYRNRAARALYLKALERATVEWEAKKPQGTVAEKLRKALDTPISLKLVEQPLGDVVRWLQDQSGVAIVLKLSGAPRTRKITANAQNISLGAAFQMLEDMADVQFGVRDYGIVATEELPSGVMSLHDFWKRGDKPKAGPEKPRPSDKNPPPAGVEGTVTQVDAGSGLVEISVGSDAGLAAGQTLEVYRTAGAQGPRYLGTLRIEEARSTRSVGKFLNRPNTPVAVGDRAAARLE